MRNTQRDEETSFPHAHAERRLEIKAIPFVRDTHFKYKHIDFGPLDMKYLRPSWRRWQKHVAVIARVVDAISTRGDEIFKKIYNLILITGA